MLVFTPHLRCRCSFPLNQGLLTGADFFSCGEIGVLPGHSPLLGLLKEPSQVRVKLAGGEQLTYDVTGGFLSIDVDGVTVLAESATPATPDAH